MTAIVSAFVFVLVSMAFLIDNSEAGWFTNCCTQSIHIKHGALFGSGPTSSEICKDGHRLPSFDKREHKSCGVKVECNYLGCKCELGCRTNDKGNCDEEALRLFLEKDGERFGIGADAQIQYPKGTTPKPCGVQKT